MTCPLCHTIDTTTASETFASGVASTCARCGQVWTASRLDTVAAYARYVAAHPAIAAGPR
jgi:hypothetical protein